jgi:uncharacterized OsmC-like protein
MPEPDQDRLTASGLPVFFALADEAARALSRPRNPYGQSIRVWARSLSVMQKEALVLSPRTDRVWRLASDEGPYLDGFDAAPCPLSFLSTGMVSAYVMEIIRLAKLRGIALHHLELVQDNYYTMSGSALRGTMTGGALPVELETRIAADAPESALRQLLDDAIQAAPITGLMKGVHASRFSLRRNGQPVTVERVASLPPLDQPDPAVLIARAASEALPAHAGLIERVAATTVIDGAAGGAHTSLAETQQRKLHLRVTCRPRADGLIEVEQRLFSPLGSTFRFLCDPTGSTAPDPAMYAAAGIAFCFMTQLGRYAKIVRKNLAAYNVVQDAHFPASGSGDVDPIETHVYLTTTEDESFARNSVEMGEQTCFLHAFCRTDLSVNTRLTVA